MGQVGGESEGVEEEQCLEHGAHQGHRTGAATPAVGEVLDDGPNAIDDEDQGNQASKDVLAEHGHVLHEGTKVEERHQDSEKGAPHAGPEVQGHELQVHSDAQVIDDQGVGEEGASGTQY